MSKHVSNEEYLERWQASGPKPVNTNWTPEQIKKYQGTRSDTTAPWESYGVEEKLTPEMESAITSYAENVHDDSSNQTKEELARWKEGNDAAAKEYQWCTPEEYHDIQARFGRILHSSTVINMLRDKCKLSCWYRTHPHADKLTLLIDQSGGTQPAQVACWVQNGWSPEYTVMGFDDHGVPLAEKYRGWRTVLLQLIMKGALTEELAHKVFGRAVAPCAGRYNALLYNWRNRSRKA